MTGLAAPYGRHARGRTIRQVVIALAVALGALAAGASSASATQPATCAPAGSTGMTAALVNPPDAAVPENLDAVALTTMQCDIGIYYNDGATHTLADKNIFDAKQYGVLSEGANTTVNISYGSIYDIGDKPHSGVQHGIAVAYRSGAGGQLDHSQLFDYQKGGVVADGAGTNVQILSNVVRGLGPVPFIAQNGVQVSRGAAGNVNNNIIEDHQYTGCSKADQRAGTCTYVVSAGILLYQVDPKLVDTRNNVFRNNDVNLLNASNL